MTLGLILMGFGALYITMRDHRLNGTRITPIITRLWRKLP